MRYTYTISDVDQTGKLERKCQVYTEHEMTATEIEAKFREVCQAEPRSVLKCEQMDNETKDVLYIMIRKSGGWIG